MQRTAAPVLEWVEDHFEESVERLKAFLRIPSVGTDPAHDGDTRRAAAWVRDSLSGIGLAAELRQTPGHPVVLAEAGAGSGPRVLYYGHYDVQPPDPLDLWEAPPFEPRIEEGPHGPRIIARGAVDNKGQLLTILEALRAWKAVEGRLPVPVVLAIEGEEESGSTHLEAFVVDHAERLRADLAVVSDTAMVAVDRPAITTMLRGLVYAEVELRGPASDLHSGVFGGAVANPIHLLAERIAALHDGDRRVTLPGFYDRVLPIPEAERRSWRELGIDEADFLAPTGLRRSFGEAGYSVLERVWGRPCLDGNGISGGYAGEGSKTVIPARASAKLSGRLVADQRPDEIFRMIAEHFRSSLPEGVEARVDHLGSADPYRLDPASPYLQLACEALEAIFGRTPVRIGCGGSIPVVPMFRRLLGIDTLLMGFGLENDRMHGPNEKFELACFRNGIRTHVELLARLAGMASG